MREFFQSWRRKAGLVTLMMALLVIGMWMRSLVLDDLIQIRYGTRSNVFASTNPKLVWAASEVGEGGFRYWWSSNRPLRQALPQVVGDKRAQRPPQWSISYWSLIVPLTLVPAYLIVWKPRERPDPN